MMTSGGIEMLVKFVIIILAILGNSTGKLVSLKDCNYKEQFYHHANRECRNCSEIGKYFLNHRDWSSREFSSGLEENNVELFSPAGSLTKPTNEVVLSRLISIDQSDPQGEEAGSGDIGGVSQAESPSYNAPTSGETGDSQFSGENSLKHSGQLIKKFVETFVRSKFIEIRLLDTINECKQQQNVAACQMWSNLCTMSMYAHSDSSSPSHSQLLLQSPRDRSKWMENNSNKQSRSRKGWQDCDEFSVNSICNGLRDWFRNEKKPNFDVQNIYTSQELDSEPDLTTRGSSKKLSNSNLLFKLNQPIQLLIYRYALNGSFLGIEQFGLNDLEQFCAITDNKKTRMYPGEENFVRVGRSREMVDCRFTPFQAQLAIASENRGFNESIFMDLYLGYSLSNGGFFIKPVPILIKNLLYNGNQVNRRHHKDASRWKLVHRFFSQAIVSLDPAGVGKHSNLDADDFEFNHNKSARPASPEVVLLFAESVSLDLKFKRQDKGVQLNSIQLTIDYNLISLPTSLNTSGSNSTRADARAHNDNYDTKVAISQKLVDMQRYKGDLDLVLSILSILSCIWSLIKYYNLHKYYGLVKLNLSSLFRFVFIACDTLANLFILVTFLFSSYLFLTLKFQSSVQLLAPAEELESGLITNLKLAFIFKLFGFAHKLYIHLNVDIFFIDWERPKMLTSSQILNYTTSMINQQQQQQQQQQPKSERADASSSANKPSTLESNNPDLTGSRSAPPYLQSASFWRPYTVVNRWLQMQTFRRQELTLQLLLFVCIIELAHFPELATSDSFSLWWVSLMKKDRADDQLFEGRNLQMKPSNSDALRLTVFALIYLTISIGQILFKSYFHEPMIRNSINEFVDLCSVANVSLFSMLYPRKGFYIHGRNANGSSDCGIAEMSALLEREERDLCSNRGLLPNSDQQTFLLILPRIINDHYRKLLYKDQLLSASNLFNSNQQLLSGQKQASLLKSTLMSFQSHSSFSSNRILIETIVAKNKAINTFLTNFLEHIYKDIDYSIREQRKFESFLRNVDIFGNGQSEEYPNGSDHSEAQTTDGQTTTKTATTTTATTISNPRNNQSNEQGENSNGVGLLMKSAADSRPSSTRATFYNDYNDSFASLLWLGLEFDLISVELMGILLFDYLLNKPPLILTVAIIWLLHQLFRAFYVACARNNLVNKALVDEKFLFR